MSTALSKKKHRLTFSREKRTGRSSSGLPLGTDLKVNGKVVGRVRAKGSPIGVVREGDAWYWYASDEALGIRAKNTAGQPVEDIKVAKADLERYVLRELGQAEELAARAKHAPAELGPASTSDRLPSPEAVAAGFCKPQGTETDALLAGVRLALPIVIREDRAAVAARLRAILQGPAAEVVTRVDALAVELSEPATTKETSP